MSKVILVDNQSIVKSGVRYELARIDASCEVVEAENKKKLVEKLVLDDDVVVVLDFSNSDFENLDEIRNMQERFEKAQWVLFSLELSETFIRNMICSNNRTSIVMKDSSIDEIRLTLASALKGERFVCHYVSNLLLSPSHQSSVAFSDPLTPTEKEILREIAKGKTTKEIAFDRCLSFHTVNTHRKNIFRKLEVNNVHEAIKYALRAGLTSLTDYCI